MSAAQPQGLPGRDVIVIFIQCITSGEFIRDAVLQADNARICRGGRTTAVLHQNSPADVILSGLQEVAVCAIVSDLLAVQGQLIRYTGESNFDSGNTALSGVRFYLDDCGTVGSSVDKFYERGILALGDVQVAADCLGPNCESAGASISVALYSCAVLCASHYGFLPRLLAVNYITESPLDVQLFASEGNFEYGSSCCIALVSFLQLQPGILQDFANELYRP